MVACDGGVKMSYGICTIGTDLNDLDLLYVSLLGCLAVKYHRRIVSIMVVVTILLARFCDHLEP